MPDERAPIEFWFDFGSPYAYFAAHAIDAVAARCGRAVLRRPFLLGAAFRETGMRPLNHTPLRGDYAMRDWQRLARHAGLPFTLPRNHPAAALPASRAFYWLEDRDPAMAAAFSQRVFDAFFGAGADMICADTAVALGLACGADADELAAGLAEPAIKQKLKDMTGQALARGIFGSPFFVADGEPFWGSDRLPMLEEWLMRGGW